MLIFCGFLSLYFQPLRFNVSIRSASLGYEEHLKVTKKGAFILGTINSLSVVINFPHMVMIHIAGSVTVLVLIKIHKTGQIKTDKSHEMSLSVLKNHPQRVTEPS